jgi:hypothetical protein
MHRLYTEVNLYGLERQKQLRGVPSHEHLSLNNGSRASASQWLHKVSEWLVDQLAFLGKWSPCLEYELACEMQFMG